MTPETISPTPPASRRLPGLLLIGLLAFGCLAACASALLIALLRPPDAISVTLVVGEIATQRQTRAATVGDLLSEHNLALAPGDQLSPAPESTLAPGLVVRLNRARAVVLTVDGVPQTLQTAFTNPFDILKSAGLTVGEHDRLLVDGTPASLVDLLVWPVPVTQISLQRAATVRIRDNGQEQVIQTTSATVGEALFAAGVTLYLADTVVPDLNSPISGETLVVITRSRPVTIVADGVTLETRSTGATVASALADAGVSLQGLDYSIPPEDSRLRPGILIRVIRVTEQVLAEQEVLPFETIYQADANLELDQRLVLQEGQNGIRQVNVRVRYENGVEISRQPENTLTASEPINRVIAYGTKIVLRTVDTPDGPREYWRKLRMYATSYHPAALGGDAITATGQTLTTGIVGSDPKVIPYGTALFVPGYGPGVMADTGMPTPRLWIDLGYDDANYVPWSRWVDVYLLTPVPQTINYLLPYSE